MSANVRQLAVIAAAWIALATAASELRGQDRTDEKPAKSDAADKALKEALAVLEAADGDTMIRARFWCEVAAFRRTRGDRAGAVEALAKARSVAESDQQAPISEWRQIGQEYARLGDAKAALELAAVVPTKTENSRGNPRELVLQEAARAAAEAGHIKPAEEIAAVLPDSAGRKRILEGIAREAMIHQAASGDAAGAIKTATKLPTAAETVFAFVGQSFLNLSFDDHTHKADGIAPAQLTAGDKPGATKTALSALALLPEVDVARRSMAALAVVRMLARLDDVTAARKALAQVSPADSKAGPRAADLRRMPELIAKGYLAGAEVRAGRDDTALGLASDFDKPGEKAYILHFTALAQARAGRKAESAVTFARAIDLVTKNPDPDPHQGGTSLHNIASAQAAAGDHAGAAKTVGLQPAGGTTWTNLAFYQAEAGDFAAARKTAADHLADSPWWSARTLEFVAERQARAGQEAAAREWIGQLDDGLAKAHALFGLAKGLVTEGQPAKK
jgi:tetratricopeptide (TPR) repeat protein